MQNPNIPEDWKQTIRGYVPKDEREAAEKAEILTLIDREGERLLKMCIRDRLYIAWNVTSPDAQGQTVFRLLQGALEGAEPNRLLAVEKAAGHRGWGKETVYVFGRDAADAFLDVVMAEEIGDRGQ